MSPLKSNRTEPLFTKVKKNITQVRKQGEPPEEDLESMEGYVCDLCKSGIKRSGIIQCPFCGRWICREKCYSSDELSCISCAGVIRLMRESVVLSDLADEGKETKEPKEKKK